LKRCLSIVSVIIIIITMLLPVAPVLADTYVDISVYAKGLTSVGIVNFTITYISETQLDFGWSYGVNTTAIMIRGKYGVYPDNISASNETPSDGYLVYSGNSTSCSDTSMDFDLNSGAIYYRAWAQLADGSWVITPEEGWKESEIMTLLAFIAMALGMSFLASKSSYYVLKFLAGMSWWAFAIYWINNTPSSITDGSSTDTAVIVLLFVIGIAFVFMPFWYTKVENGQERGGRMRLPFMKTDAQEDADKKRAYRPSRNERTSAYEDRITNAMSGIKNNQRR
jgi:hypothetical protein